MLTIHLAGYLIADPGTTDGAYFYEGSIADLFRTVRVIGEHIVFIEPTKGHLINLAEVERIEEDQPDLTTEEAVSVLEDEAEQSHAVEWAGRTRVHDGPESACELAPCSLPGPAREVEQAQPTW
jgi:hypothetical protein